ncbi:MAG: hypothetical protein KY397_03155 [Gemmatimonadetes bacterium]|nr:hypothetical protein [Gemmatimonadota bacterium]
MRIGTSDVGSPMIARRPSGGRVPRPEDRTTEGGESGTGEGAELELPLE